MERNEALEIATGGMHMEIAKAKKLDTKTLVKKVGNWLAMQPKSEVIVEKTPEKTTRRGRPANSNKVVKEKIKRGTFMLGWNTVTGNVRALKYCNMTRNGQPFQTIIDLELEPHRMPVVRKYKKMTTAEAQVTELQNTNPEYYKGLEIITCYDE